MNLNIQDSFTLALPADPNESNSIRQVKGACYSFVTPKKPKLPSIVHVSEDAASLLGLQKADWQSREFLEVFSGNKILADSQPYAMCYGGHQFGHWAGQLGDGRAINLFEVVHQHKRWALQLKGAGKTPYSRTADGLAVLRSSIREHLCSEAMFALGVPTTRSLSLMLSGDQVMRDMLYDGHPEYEKGAIVCRVSPSFIRFGNFQMLAAQEDLVNLRKLCDYTIQYFFPEIQSTGKQAHLDFFQEVANRTRKMIVEWDRVGFVHGVMNTDNMSILGLTIDYGPYGWLEPYDKNWTPNTTDRSHKRYRFGNQGIISLWNLLQLANALYPIIEDKEGLEAILGDYRDQYRIDYLTMMSQKLGLQTYLETDEILIDQLELNLQASETDMTLFFRKLSQFSDENNDWKNILKDAFYQFDEIEGTIENAWNLWFEHYQNRLKQNNWSKLERKKSMNQINPKYVLRNYMAQLAIDAADQGDYSVVNELYELMKNPYDEQFDSEKWFAKRPEWARDKVGCSMLSCSS